MATWSILGDIVILLAGALLVGGLMSRIGQSPILGYLIAGMLLGGPGSLRAVRSSAEIETISELGVALLLFGLGLEFSIQRLRRLGPKPLIGGVIQVVATLLLGAVFAYCLGASMRSAFAIGAMISLSSTAVVLRTLMERAEVETPHGKNSVAVLLTQDIAVVPLAMFVTLLGGSGDLREFTLQVGKLALMAGVLVVSLIVLTWVAVRALGTLTLLRNRELTVIFAVSTGLGSAWVAHAAGISPALGAFVAGMLLGSSAFATQIRADVSSLRVLLLTLFFGSAGMVADPLWILANWYLVVGVTALLTIGKVIVIWAIFRGLGHSSRVAAATGICLAQVGEFAFVLGNIGRENGVINQDTAALMVSVTIFSFAISAILVPLAPRLGNRLARLLGHDSGAEPTEAAQVTAPDVLVIGFGPTGRIATRNLIESGKEIIVIDLNREGVQSAQRLGFRGEIGDATQPEVLEHANLEQAKTIVITVPHHASALMILEYVKQRAPHAFTIVRSRYQLHAKDFLDAGAHVVLGDEELVGERIAEILETKLGNRDADAAQA